MDASRTNCYSTHFAYSLSVVANGAKFWVDLVCKAGETVCSQNVC